MRETLEDLYYGRINPCEHQMSANRNLLRVSSKITQCENQLKERLDEQGLAILAEMVDAHQEISCVTAMENFILGFRLGARILFECLDEDDGDMPAATGSG